MDLLPVILFQLGNKYNYIKYIKKLSREAITREFPNNSSKINKVLFLFTNILFEKPCQLKLILLKLLSTGFTLSLRFITLKQFKMLSGVVQVFLKFLPES